MGHQQSKIEDDTLEQRVREWERQWGRNAWAAAGCYAGKEDSGKDVRRCVLTVEEARRAVKSWVQLSDEKPSKLPIKVFQFWYDALIANDAPFIHELLQVCSEDESHLLLNGQFVFEEKRNNTAWLNARFDIPPCNFQLPLCLALSSNSGEALKILIQRGADLLQRDTGGHNIIHALILISAVHAKKDFSNLYADIMETMDVDHKREILFMENEDAYRPLEFAGLLEEFHLQLFILRTRGVYLFSEGNQGAYERLLYDVTDYETHGAKSRRGRSPLFMMLLATKAGLASEQDREALMSIPFQRWRHIKKMSNLVWFRVWLVLRLLFIILTLATISYLAKLLASRKNIAFANATEYYNCSDLNALDFRNDSCPSMTYIQYTCDNSSLIITAVALCGVCALIFISNVYTTMKRFCKRSLPNSTKFQRKDYLVSIVFYDAVQFLISISFFVMSASVLLLLQSSYHGTVYTLFVVFYIIGNTLQIWSILFFLQFSPGIGHFAITIQRILGDISSFLFIFVLFLGSFSRLFEGVLTLNGYCNELRFQQEGTLYSTFILMLNMIDVSDYRQVYYSLDLLHVAFVVVVCILLLNFLIAIMSNTVQEVDQYRNIITPLQHLHTYLSIEEHFRWIFGFLYRRYHRHHLVVEGDRILLPTLEETQTYAVSASNDISRTHEGDKNDRN